MAILEAGKTNDMMRNVAIEVMDDEFFKCVLGSIAHWKTHYSCCMLKVEKLGVCLVRIFINVFYNSF